MLGQLSSYQCLNVPPQHVVIVRQPFYIDELAVRYYVAVPDEEDTPVRHYYCQGTNFNVTAVTDDSGEVLERYQYTSYGEVMILDDHFAVDSNQISDIGNTHLYTGRERDNVTGLQLNRHRYYTSHFGRWLTRDPIEYEERGRPAAVAPAAQFRSQRIHR